jgi:hypothetical protein
MLMATAITLLMMAAVVTLFANLSGSIRNRRAAIEMNSQLRQVRHRLARDLAGCTVPLTDDGLVPWQRPGEAIGYFEIYEGDQSDADPSELLEDDNNDGLPDGPPDGIDPGSTLLPGSQLADVDNGVSSDGMGLGDYDDYLALTVRSESEPFVGDRPTYGDPDGDGTFEWIREPMEDGSTLAEVIWYAVETQPDDPSTDFDESLGGEPGMRRVFRRQLLIAPWVEQIESLPLYDPSRGFNDPDNDPQTLTNDEYYAVSDISFHLEGNLRVPNTLADLTRRECRWLHEIDFVFKNEPPPGINDLDFPHEFDLRDIDFDLLTSPKYLVLNNVLAFDVRVYDPGAPLFMVGRAGPVTPDNAMATVDPNDPGWQEAMDGNLNWTLAGFGAYVDLGWNNAGTYVPNFSKTPPDPATLFQQERQAGWHPNAPGAFRTNPSTYDTWTWHYENDRRDQYQNGIDDNGDDIPDRHMDDAVDGIDDDSKNGVDDPGERETWPPYNVPLRGVRVILRTYEFDSRQIREASVTSSFVP